MNTPLEGIGFAEAQLGFDAFVKCHGVTIPLARGMTEGILSPAILKAINRQSYEAREAAFLPSIVEPGDRVLEIGAGIGVISTLVARAAPVERIVAVEANPRLVPFIREVHRLNGVAAAEVIHGVLAAEGGGTLPFYLREDFWMSSLAPGPEPFVATVEVPVADLSALLRRERIDLVICDIEGAEAALFEGVDLAGVDRVYVELHDHLTGIDGIARLFATLAAAGLAYDPRGSSGPVVLFRRVVPGAPLRPYSG